MTDRLYKVTGPAGEATNGGSGVWHRPSGKRPGKWMPEVTPVVPCKSGYHLVTVGQLPQWLGPRIWVAEFHPDAEVVDHGDKLVGSKARLVAATAWDDRSARLFAADCAEHVLHLFEDQRPDDKRPRAAITAARRFADGEIDRATLSEAGAAASAAACAAACTAAWDAAWAARAAAWDAACTAAWDAAWAARAAAWDAARDAAWAAARAAERSWQAERLAHYLHPEEADQ